MSQEKSPGNQACPVVSLVGGAHFQCEQNNVASVTGYTHCQSVLHVSIVSRCSGHGSFPVSRACIISHFLHYWTYSSAYFFGFELTSRAGVLKGLVPDHQ